jgi:nucleotide-binding universal stress UspA family protein
MSAWARTGPVAVEVDGSAEGLRFVDYACLEALRREAALVLVTPYPAHAAFDPRTPGYQPKPPAEVADAGLRRAVAHVRHHYGYGLQLEALSREGARSRVLPMVARHARMLVVGRTRARGPHRLVAAQANLTLAGRAGCPVVVVPLSWKPSAVDRKVAVGIDGTALSREAIEFAFRSAAAREGDLMVVHAGLPADRAWNGDDVEHSWITRADRTISEWLAAWTSRFPDVRVTRFVSSRPPAAALVHESQEVGLVVVGSHLGPLPLTDPVARHSVAAMTCPVAIVPHHPTIAELDDARRIRDMATTPRALVVDGPTHPFSMSGPSHVGRLRGTG